VAIQTSRYLGEFRESHERARPSEKKGAPDPINYLRGFALERVRRRFEDD